MNCALWKECIRSAAHHNLSLVYRIRLEAAWYLLDYPDIISTLWLEICEASRTESCTYLKLICLRIDIDGFFQRQIPSKGVDVIGRTDIYSVIEYGDSFGVGVERAGATVSDVTAIGWLGSCCTIKLRVLISRSLQWRSF